MQEDFIFYSFFIISCKIKLCSEELSGLSRPKSAQMKKSYILSSLS